MANSKNKNAPRNEALTKKEQAEKNRRSAKRTTVFIAAFVAVAIVAVIVVGVIALINYNINKENQRLENATFDSDIGEYIYLSPDIYSNFDVNIGFPKPADIDVENEIIKLLYSKRGGAKKEALYNTSVGIKAGDEVSLLYRAYCVGENGEKVYFSSGTNFADGESVVAIGADEFCRELEKALVNVVADEYLSLESDSQVRSNSFAVLTVGEESEVVDMSTADAALRDALLGCNEGDSVTAQDFADATLANIYTPVSNDGVTAPILSVELTLPDDFADSELRGKDAVCEVYVSNVKKFNAPIYNDAFIVSVLKLTADDLSKYEGEKLTDKYENKIRKELGEDVDIEYERLKTLYANRGEVRTDEGWRDDEPIQAGDTVNLFYRGYYLENGERVYFDGGCNFGSDYTSLGIGSGGFVSGFEIGLVGKTPTDYLTYIPNTATDATVGEDDVVYITYSYAPYEGSTQSNVTAVVNMRDENLDEVWGEGFRELLLGTKLGDDVGESHLRENVNEYGNIETDVFMSIKVSGLYTVESSRADNEVLTVDVIFPSDYESEDLRNKAATFEVYVLNVQKYETPVFDDSFISKTLEITPEELADFEGETLVEKYEAKLLSKLMEDYEDDVINAVSDRMWEVYTEGVEIIRLPEGNVQDNYDAMVAEIEYAYEYYNQYYQGMYASLDECAADYLGVSASTWREEVRKQSEEAVIKQLVFYYVVKESGFVPTEEEKQKLYDEEYQLQLEDYLEQSGCTPDKFDTEAEYEAKKKSLSESFASSYDEAYANENVLYNYGLEKIYEEYANILTND